MAGMFRKYLVQRRDGTIPEWPWFVIGAKDPVASYAIRAYALEAERRSMDPAYISDLYAKAAEFEDYLQEHGAGDPDGAKHREDDLSILEKMHNGGEGK
jgi:hypothetical protein